MSAYLLEWLNLLGRWAHLIVGIAWIGASFYFIWLDDHLQAPKSPADAAKGVGGEVWSVHGGGFYHAQKYRVAPAALPETLHWFKWEAYTTWISGMFLMGLIYYWGAEVALIDPQVRELSQWQAIGIGLAFIAGGWIVYDLLCRSPVGQDELLLGVVLFVLTSAAAWVLCQLFSGRGAFIHYGAILGTIMVFNVFFVIIPGQRELVTAKQQGREPDPRHGLRGRQRSVHNTYFTLPVLFTMIANHYAFVTGHAWNWAIMIALAFAGAMIRLWFVLRHKGNASPLPLAAGLVTLVALALLLAPRGDNLPEVAQGEVDFPKVAQVIAVRCATCHAAQPTREGFAAPPKGVMLETPAQMRAYAHTILQQAVTAKAMPPGNLTEMTEEERELVRRWIRAGAPVR
jgi:uncharacterized membrane protein